MYKIVCSECECLYESKFSTAKFCGDKCRSKYNRKHRGHKRICSNCNQAFNSYKPKKYCSEICKEESVELKKNIERKEIEEAEKKKAIKKLLHSLSNIDSRIKKCVRCDKDFIMMRGTAGYKYCSQTCKAKGYKVNRKKYRIAREKRWSRNGKADLSIDLQRLYKRDEGVCHICGELTDITDYHLTEQNHFIAGNNYPSIDHVTAIANGGLHQWNNVKLAHRLCNSLKQDKTFDY